MEKPLNKEAIRQMYIDRATRFLTALDATLPPTLTVTRAMWQVPIPPRRSTTLVLLIPRARHSWKEDLKVIYKGMNKVLDNIEPPIVEFRSGNVTCKCSERDFNKHEVYYPVR